MARSSGKERGARPLDIPARPGRGTHGSRRRPAPHGEGPGPLIPSPGSAAGASADIFDVIVLGAGASGLACAAEAARRGLRVLLLERGPRPGRKLAVSGGGRANFSNRSVTPEDYLCPSGPQFLRPALKALPPEAVLQRMRDRGLPVEERDHGRLFLTVPALRLVRALEADCAGAGCRLVCGAEARAVQREGGGFAVECGDGVWRARALVLALGSPAFPQAGGTQAGWRMAASLRHTLSPARPALVPLRLPEAAPLGAALRGLAGISLNCRLTLPDAADGTRRSFEDDLLFTHTGLSGPLILGASLFWRDGHDLVLDLLPGENVEALLDGGGGRTPRGILRGLLPQRLVDAVLPPALASRKAAELSRGGRREIASALQALTLRPMGTEGLARAEACSGGVDTAEVDARTMESRLVPHLHIVGELLDVTGRLGGYNLHWAWASGLAAGRAVLAGTSFTGCKTASPKMAR
ncbi:aminoacetone oxidase family FAD-binding enzyme [Desulfovibrio sp.]|uniref:NAD(P)/FAD-dependent oxidoreductase n=1 Tax=Desulfovibrio sp. TaxID=885 RepID=UPI0023D756A0|nr:aminoacetone oxidase family FAD-binding enzyme [Desulfovibrio sp.]MDE7240709.1 aminoacetone oxidase family FAD-binding enzyme [Desulfovibrio sp.]